ncbi:LysR family transcriptional regulator, partial [Bradyrhizobium sp.]|uniref:LysR family transcriptional regulator n=1 Tax=Bradyrhizobium sp. TaxID=376 RepID=UPI003C40D19E
MLDPVLLQTFLAIAQTRSFTRAAERLGLRQSTVSQHIRKLEDEAGRRLFVRDTHSVTMTADGEAMIEFARGIVAANERAERYFAGSKLRGRLRFGASEDFVTSLLPELLREFVRTHPLVEFELTVGMSGELNQRLERGELDLVCGKRRPGEDRGRVVWRDRLAWV